MTRGSRIALLVVALLVLAGGIALATSSGGDDDSDAGGTQAAETTPAAPDEATGRGETATQEAPPPPRVESIRIRDGQPAGNARTLKFDKGDTVRLRFSANTESEVHIHGYDKELAVPAGGTKTVRFKATLDGVFEIEDHHSEALLAKLEVRP